MLEFPAFVLIGVYSPATRDETRTEFRFGFHEAMDARVRNLVAMGKQVILTGDLNITRNEWDTAGLQETLKKEDMTLDDFLSTPSRRFFNQLLYGGKVVGERDEGREEPVLWDICREFHPDRRGMYTCWETRKNARPGNYGSRIDYVLCSSGIKDWFVDSNIQEGLLGSDHCPVYATLHDTVEVQGKSLHIIDKMNPEGMFVDGKRVLEWSTKHLLPTSAKLIPEFDRRRSIRDMFFKPKNKETPVPGATGSRETPEASSTSALGSIDPKNKGVPHELTSAEDDPLPASSLFTETSTLVAETSSLQTRALQSPARELSRTASQSSNQANASRNSPAKRAVPGPSSSRPSKKGKATLVKSDSKSGPGKSQSSLMGFFKPKTPTPAPAPDLGKEAEGSSHAPPTNQEAGLRSADHEPAISNVDDVAQYPAGAQDSNEEKFIDPIQSKESWSKLLGKRVPPMCEHDEPCISLLTKKPGVNCGESSTSLHVIHPFPFLFACSRLDCPVWACRFSFLGATG